MKQIIQYQKTGEIFIEELSAPKLKGGGILVHYIYFSQNGIVDFEIILLIFGEKVGIRKPKEYEEKRLLIFSIIFQQM